MIPPGGAFVFVDALTFDMSLSCTHTFIRGGFMALAQVVFLSLACGVLVGPAKVSASDFQKLAVTPTRMDYINLCGCDLDAPLPLQAGSLTCSTPPEPGFELTCELTYAWSRGELRIDVAASFDNQTADLQTLRVTFGGAVEAITPQTASGFTALVGEIADQTGEGQGTASGFVGQYPDLFTGHLLLPGTTFRTVHPSKTNGSLQAQALAGTRASIDLTVGLGREAVAPGESGRFDLGFTVRVGTVPGSGSGDVKQGGALDL